MDKLADQTGNWDAATAQTVFTTMLGQHPDINAVMVANDTMAQSVINVLASQGLAGKVAVSGQDATAGGLDNVMAGTQCFTVYKPVAGEADVAISLPSQILAGQKPSAPTTIKDPTNGREIPSYLADRGHHQGERGHAGARRLRHRRVRVLHPALKSCAPPTASSPVTRPRPVGWGRSGPSHHAHQSG